MQERIIEKISQYGLNDKAKMLGLRSDVNELYSAFDCFALPSRFEGLGIVLIEAQCSGCPCVATAGTIPDAAKITEDFAFIESENVDAWVEAIVKMREKNIDRSIGYKVVSNAGYNAKELAKMMENIYLSEG